MKVIEYDKLRLDILQRLIDERGINCRNNKTDMVRHLILDDEGKYIRETTYLKEGEGFIIGIDIKNRDHQLQISKLIEKKDAKNLHRYCDNRIQYWSKQKLI